MGKRLSVTLLGNWVDVSDKNPEGPTTFIRENSKESGALQISCAWYVSGEQPRPTDDDLMQLAHGIAQRFDGCEVKSASCGACALGRFGSAIFKSEECVRGQVWVLSNGLDFVNVTLLNVARPAKAELVEANQIVMQLEIHEAV